MVSRFIGIGKESTYGEDVALTEFISAIDEGFAEDNQIIAEEEMGQRGMNKPQLGAFKSPGGFKFYGEPENMGLFLLGLFGEVATTPGAGASEYIHTFKASSTPQYLTVGVGTGVTSGQKTYPGFATKKGKFTLAPNAKLLVEAEGFPKTINLDALASPSYSPLDPFVFHQGSVEIATSPNTDVQAMVIEIENLWKEDEYTIGSRLLRKATMQGVKVSGTMDLLFDDLTQFELFLGKAAQTDPLEGEPPTKQLLELLIDTGIVINVTDTYQLNFNMLEVLYKTSKANINKQERTIQNLEWEAYNPASGEQIEAVLYNGASSY